MKIFAILSIIALAACSCIPAAAQTDARSSAVIAESDSSGTGSSPKMISADPQRDSLALERTIPHDQGYSKPRIADFITDLPGAWGDWGRSTFRTDNIPMYTGIGILTVAMVVTDHQTYPPLRKLYNDNHTFHQVAETFQFMGDGWFQFGIGAAFGLHGLVFNDMKSLSTASQTVEVILACGGVVQTLKHLTGRESPFVATSHTGKWILFPNQIEYAHHVPHYDAYPSGHVATFMATLTVLTENYPDATWLKYVGYPTAGMIGLSMMGTGIHWMSDFPLSWALGYTFGKIVAHRHKPAENDMAQENKFTPQADITIMNNGSPGIALSWKW